MLVRIQSFGCNWWKRVGRSPNDRFRYTKHSAFYNSTGIRCGNKIRRRWVIPGLIRFNGVGDFSVHPVDFYIGQTFSCTERVFELGGNRVVFLDRIKAQVSPDWFLVVVSSEQFGMIDFRSRAWASDRSQPIAASHLREKQETMLLMGIGDWIETNLGRWNLVPTSEIKAGVILQLSDDV